MEKVNKANLKKQRQDSAKHYNKSSVLKLDPDAKEKPTKR